MANTTKKAADAVAEVAANNGNVIAAKLPSNTVITVVVAAGGAAIGALLTNVLRERAKRAQEAVEEAKTRHRESRA